MQLLKLLFILNIAVFSTASISAEKAHLGLLSAEINSKDTSKSFAASTLIGLFDHTHKTNLYTRLAKSFYTVITSDQSLREWHEANPITTEALVVLSRYSMIKLAANPGAVVSVEDAAYIAKRTSRPDIKIAALKSIGADSLSEYFANYTRNTSEAGESLSFMRYSLYHGADHSLEMMSAYNRTVVTAEEECESLINAALLAMDSNNLDRTFTYITDIYIEEKQWLGFLEMLRFAVIRGDYDLGLKVASTIPSDGLKQITNSHLYIETIAWLMALSELRLSYTKPTKDIIL